MNLYTFRCWGHLHPGDFGGWEYNTILQEGINMSSFKPEMGIGFFNPKGALLFDTRRKSEKGKIIDRAYFSKKAPSKFPTQHIVREHCTKVLHFTSKPCPTVKDILVLITFEGEIFKLLDNVLQSLRIQKDSVINYETNQVITGNGISVDYFVFSITVVIPNGHYTGIICDGKSLRNNNGVLKILN